MVYFFALELIETFWNVNWNQGRLKERKEKELIETLWNVNTIEPILVGIGTAELIETLWNVNASTFFNVSTS